MVEIRNLKPVGFFPKKFSAHHGWALRKFLKSTSSRTLLIQIKMQFLTMTPMIVKLNVPNNFQYSNFDKPQLFECLKLLGTCIVAIIGVIAP